MQSANQLFNLKGHVAIVTGGSKGLGKAMAEGLASAGAHVVITSRNREEAQMTAQSIEDTYQTHAIGMAADVTAPEAVERMADKAMNTFGKIDILINNAGINIRGAIDELSLEEFRKVQEINVDGVWLATKAVVPHMKKANYGRIINIASTLGLVGLGNRTPYTASKGAVVQMTRALSLELASWNITCNAICPGPFLTEMNIPVKDDEQTKKFIVGAVALGRWGELDEIKSSAIYLSSPGASYTTGCIMTVDGGWTAR